MLIRIWFGGGGRRRRKKGEMMGRGVAHIQCFETCWNASCCHNSSLMTNIFTICMSLIWFTKKMNFVLSMFIQLVIILLMFLRLTGRNNEWILCQYLEFPRLGGFKRTEFLCYLKLVSFFELDETESNAPSVKMQHFGSYFTFFPIKMVKWVKKILSIEISVIFQIRWNWIEWT